MFIEGISQNKKKMTVLNFTSEKRQTMLFSATTTKKTEDLIKVALKKEPIYVGLEDRIKEGD